MNNPANNKMTEDEVVELVNSFSNLSGLNFLWAILKWVFTGMFMGTSDAIPGYSGGTTLALLGVFKRLILIAKSMFVPEHGITRLKAWMFMVPFFIGWITGIFGFAKLTEYLAENNMGLELMFFFSAFIMFAIPIFLRSENPQLFDAKRERRFYLRWTFFVVGFLIVIGIGLYIFLGTDGVEFHGSEKAKNGKDSIKFDIGDRWWILILVAVASGMITLIPGGSGAIIQLISGMYDDIHWTIMAHPLDNFFALILFAVSTLSGMLIMVFAFSWALKHIEKELAALSFGMLAASVVTIFLVPEHSLWHNLEDSALHDTLVPLAWLAGAGAALTLNYFVIWRKPNEQIAE